MDVTILVGIMKRTKMVHKQQRQQELPKKSDWTRCQEKDMAVMMLDVSI